VRLVPIVLVLAGLWAAFWYGRRYWRQNHTTLQFAALAGFTPALELTFFPDRVTFAAPSPPLAIGELRIDGSTVTVGAELVPERAMVRYRGPGIGAGVMFVELGRDPPPVPLRAPHTLSGRVGTPVSPGPTPDSVGLRAVAGAEVIAMGGGEHGVDLATTRTDAEGRFTLTGIDGELDGLGLRVRAAGFAIHHEVVGRAVGRDPIRIALEPGRRQIGTVAATPDVELRTVRILARGLPGVESSIASDGSFALEHLPNDSAPRLLLHGLPKHVAHAPQQVGDGQPIAIAIVHGAIVRGRVVDATSRRGLSGALVWCGESDAVRADGDGRFELPQLMPGAAELSAQWQQVDRQRRRLDWVGSLPFVLQAGTVHEDIEILVVTG
jgi:hypothetical protein